MGRRVRGSAPWPLDIDLAFNPAEPRDASGKWTAGELYALTDWLGSSTFDRGPAPSIVRTNFASAIEKAPLHTAPVYRGIGSATHGGVIFRGLEKGDLLHWAEHKSASSSRVETGQFGNDTYIIKGAPGREFPYDATQHLAAEMYGGLNAPGQQWAKEREVVLPPGDYEVTGLGMSLKNGSISATLTYRGPVSAPEGVTKRKDRGLDLARPAVVVRPHRKVDEDATVRQIALLLRTGYRFKRLAGDFDQEVEGITKLLAPYGIGQDAVRLAVLLTHAEGGGRRGTAHSPNARLEGGRLTDEVRDIRDHDVYFRAAYIANAAQRMQVSIGSGASPREAFVGERRYYQMHEEARKGRLKAASQVERAGRMFGWPEPGGHLVGWYLNPLLKNEAECIAANGHNFYAEKGTTIGLPGAVHNRCGCYAGPPWEGAAMVDDVFRNLTALRPPVSHAKFKLKERQGA